ncbi:aspartate/glutamate racemase family protein [Rhizobium pusense]|uniref:aspartate/glutamate racemase family protein n=1 Tax=Agrobacterium pusense TaxID=648995 RepID=UPI00244B37B7|nr:aspartate/glutamate racemase family protein [Agrobacterium pusense]MDH1271749.1 aspartate/glutamate racemase family protein [Agrobacterium pusense]
MRLALINPNTSEATTVKMVSIARSAITKSAVEIVGVTAPFGAPLITNEVSLEVASLATVTLIPSLESGGFDGVIVAAFGDPGLQELRQRLTVPVTGIAEAGMHEAAQNGRRFAVVTTTPELVDVISRASVRYGHENFAGTWLTPGDPVELMSNPVALTEALRKACLQAVEEGKAEALIIGGGPLAEAARELTKVLDVPLIEPVPAAVRLATSRLMTEKR